MGLSNEKINTTIIIHIEELLKHPMPTLLGYTKKAFHEKNSGIYGIAKDKTIEADDAPAVGGAYYGVLIIVKAFPEQGIQVYLDFYSGVYIRQFSDVGNDNFSKWENYRAAK